MRQKLGLIAPFAAVCLITGVWLGSANNCAAYTQTVSGSVEASQSLGSSSEMGKINQWLNRPSDEIWGTGSTAYLGVWGVFQANLLKKVIEQAGPSNYPATYALILDTSIPYGNRLGHKGIWNPNGFSQNFPEGYSDALGMCVFASSSAILPCLEQHGSIMDSRIPNEISKLKSWLKSSDSGIYSFLTTDYRSLNLGTRPWMNGVTIESMISALSCRHINRYNYSFKYNISQSGKWPLVSDTTAHKCENIKLVFAPSAEWCAEVTGSNSNKKYNFNYPFLSPPTAFLACAGQADCLSKTKEYALTSNTFGKGVQKVPTDFIGLTERSLTSSNAYMKCTNGVCVSYTSGTFPLTATTPASSYFGQCRGFGATVNTPEAAVPAVKSNATVKIVNRAPVPTVTISKNPIAIDEEADLVCDIVDPDACSDKITKVKWTCADSSGKSDKCFIWKQGTGAWNAGSTTQDIITSEQGNPFRATAKFKAGLGGSYSITCEVWDNDANNQLSGKGITAVQVAGSCAADNVCNPNCNPPDPDCNHCGLDKVCVQGCNPPDPDCAPSCLQDGSCVQNCTPIDPDCVIAAHRGSCALISPDGGSENISCGDKSEVKYKAYISGIDAVTYKWKCASDSAVKETGSPETTCSYDGKGSYLPSLSIVDKNKVEIPCVTQTSATMGADPGCKLKIRPAGTGDDYSNKDLGINSDQQVEAKLETSCAPGGKAKWEVTNGNVVEQSNSSAKIKFNSVGSGSVKSTVTTEDGKTLDCGLVEVKIKEKVQFGT